MSRKLGPEMVEKIKKLYVTAVPGSGEVRAFAKKHGIHRSTVLRVAQRNGIVKKERRYPPWSEKELDIVERLAAKSATTIRAALKKKGYDRTVCAILTVLKRNRFRRNIDGQSAGQLAECFGVDEKFVTRAISLGQLRAKRKEKDVVGESAEQGRTFLIRDKDVKAFIVDNISQIDLRKVDKYWFVDLLTGS